MNAPRRLLISLALGLTGSAGALAASASGSIPVPPPNAPPQEKQVDMACIAAVASIQKALSGAATVHVKTHGASPVKTITSPLQVTTPGVLTARLAFNRSGRSIRVAGEHQSARGSQTYGCGESSAGGRGLGPGRSRVVSTVQRTFTAPGRYTISFRLNQVGQRMVAQLAAAQRAYRSQHPNGKAPPTLAFGVSLDYTSPTS